MKPCPIHGVVSILPCGPSEEWYADPVGDPEQRYIAECPCYSADGDTEEDCETAWDALVP